MDGNESNEEVLLIEEIHEEIRKIRHFKDSLENNAHANEFHNPIAKCLLENNSLRMVLAEQNISGCSVKFNPMGCLQKYLEKELECIHKEVAKLVRKTKDLEDFTARLSKNSENLQLMLKASNESQFTSSKLDVIEKNIKQRFLKEKKELKTIITTLFTDNLDVTDLIAQITEFYFAEGADKYMKVEDSDNVEDQIEFLLRTQLFEVNPRNPKEIKLASLV